MHACQVLQVINRNQGPPEARTFLLLAEETVATQVKDDTYVKTNNQTEDQANWGNETYGTTMTPPVPPPFGKEYISRSERYVTNGTRCKYFTCDHIEGWRKTRSC